MEESKTIKEVDETSKSEEKYLTILNSLKEPMHMIDRNYKFQFFNLAMSPWLEKFNINVDIIGKNLFEVFPFLERDKLFNEYDKVFKTGEIIITQEITQIETQRIFTEIQKIPVKNNGKVKQVITIVRDITEQKEAEEKLKTSEENYKNIINNLMDITVILDTKGNFLYTSPQVIDITGYTQEEIIGKNGFKLLHPEDIQTAAERLREAIVKKEKIYLEFRFLHKQGHYIYLSASGRIVNLEGEERIFVIVRDLTAQKISEQKLKESEEKFRTIAEQSFIGIIIIQDGVFKYFNEEAFRINNYSREEVHNWKPFEFLKTIHPDDRDFVMEQVLKKQAGDPDVQTHYQYRVLNKNGKVFWVDNFSKSINYEGKPADFVMTIDITDKMEAEQKLKESEEKFSKAFSTNYLSMSITSYEEGKCIEVNDAFLNFFGFTREEVIGKTTKEIGMWANENNRNRILRTLDEQGSVLNLENKYKSKTGETKYGLISFIKIILNGKPFVLTIQNDITLRKLAEQQLIESEENFRTIAEQAFVGSLIIQNDKVEYVNDALLGMFEFTKEDVENWTINDLIKLIYPEDFQNLREHRKRIKEGESDLNPLYSYRVFTKYGRLKWIDQHLKQIVYRGKPAELITIMDITEKKKAEQELIKLNNLKSEILRRTSHELKTPLVSIKGFSDLLLTVHKEKLDDYVLATINEIKLGCERLESLIQDILKTSELETDSVELKKQEEDLSFLIKLCIKELQGLIRLRNHEISLEIHDKLISWFEPDQIHLVISNLLSNAIKYTPPDGKIIIKSAKTQDDIVISIQDNGIGITNEEKKRLFSQFGKIERYGQGLDIITEGSGLGLYITKKIIELHGGTIKVKSKGRNRGSTFSFTLPLIVKNKVSN